MEAHVSEMRDRINRRLEDARLAREAESDRLNAVLAKVGKAREALYDAVAGLQGLPLHTNLTGKDDFDLRGLAQWSSELKRENDGSPFWAVKLSIRGDASICDTLIRCADANAAVVYTACTSPHYTDMSLDEVVAWWEAEVDKHLDP